MAETKTQRRVMAFSKLSQINRDSLAFYYYFKKIHKELKDKGWSRKSEVKEYKLKFVSPSFEYRYDAYELTKRVFARLGWKLTMNVYTLTPEKEYSYTWTLTKNN